MKHNLGLISFAQSYALRTGLSDKQALHYCREFITLLQDELLSGQGYTFQNFGAFTVVEQGPYSFNSNLEKGQITIPKHKKIKFKVAAAFKKKMRK